MNECAGLSEGQITLKNLKKNPKNLKKKSQKSQKSQKNHEKNLEKIPKVPKILKKISKITKIFKKISRDLNLCHFFRVICPSGLPVIPFFSKVLLVSSSFDRKLQNIPNYLELAQF